MIREAQWQEIHRLVARERWSQRAIARALDLDRKTVRRCLRQQGFTPYHRPPMEQTVLATHAEWLRDRTPAVGYSAQIVFQELISAHGYTGSYETVKRFLRPLCARQRR